MASINEIQALVEQIKADLPLLINRSQVTPQQIVVVEGLSDISERLGLVQAGEFRTGNGQEPGYGFSGVRIGYPAFAYAGDTWNIAGVDNDVLQVGIRSSDGKLIAGAGSVVIGSAGVIIENASPSLVFEDSSGNVDTIYINAREDDLLEIRNNVIGGGLYVIQKTTDGADPAPYILFREHLATADAIQLEIGPGTAGGMVDFFGTFIFNDITGVVDFFGSKFIFDGGSEERLEIGADHYFPTRNSSNPNGFWNEANQDMDFTFEGTGGDVLKIDAGLDAVGIGGAAESGKKLKVTGAAKVTGGIDLASSNIRSLSVSLADDTATSITPNNTVGGAILLGHTGGSVYGFYIWNTGSGGIVGHVGGAITAFLSNTPLTGTTGTDGQFSVSVYATDGKLYFENRIGGTMTFYLLLL